MKIIYTLLLLSLSHASFGVVNQGDKISAKRFNESISHVGEIKQALLTEEQFQSLYGECWVKMSGQSVAGSDYATITGQSSLPNAEGRFLRNSGGNALPLGSVQEDAFQGHHHNVVAGNTGGNNVSRYDGGNNYAAEYPRATTIISDGVNGTPRISNETRPVNLVVNMFIKINHECN